MNTRFLQDVIIPQRDKEMGNGEHGGTNQPIYVVLDLWERFCTGHSDIPMDFNYKGEKEEYGYIDMALEDDDRKFHYTDEEMEEPEAVTRFFVDEVVAFFFTKKAANEYMGYQSHNLSNPYLYIFHSGKQNHEMDMLLK